MKPYMPAYLDSPCGGYCAEAACPHAVKLNPATGRWYITIGHPGFNSRANNGDGYASEATALAAFHRYSNA